MKKAKNRNLIILIVVLFFVLFGLSRLTDMTSGFGYPAFTSFSTGRQGTSLIYDTLRIMGYSVGRDITFLSADRSTDDVQFVIAPRHFSEAHAEGLMDWVIRGGQLMFFSRGNWDEHRLWGDIIPDSSVTVAGGVVHRVGFGTIFIGDARRIINISLLETDGEYGQMIVNVLESMNFRWIYFNEAYHGYGYNATFFEILPRSWRLVAWQVGIIFVVIVVHFGRRFGRPTPFYEEVEREENEYVFTLTNLYMSMGFGSTAVAVYDKKFRKQAADHFNIIVESNLEQIYEQWHSEGKHSLDKLKYLIDNQDTDLNTNRKQDRAEFMRMIRYYKELMKELKR